MTKVFDVYISKIKAGDGSVIGYKLIRDFVYYSARYKKYVDLKVTNTDNDIFDGATGAKDINSMGWSVHDVLKRDKKWSDGTECTNWQASNVLRDILNSEGRVVRSHTWFVSTLLWGFFVR